jgi:hypothetical protein
LTSRLLIVDELRTVDREALVRAAGRVAIILGRIDRPTADALLSVLSPASGTYALAQTAISWPLMPWPDGCAVTVSSECDLRASRAKKPWPIWHDPDFPAPRAPAVRCRVDRRPSRRCQPLPGSR